MSTTDLATPRLSLILQSVRQLPRLDQIAIVGCFAAMVAAVIAPALAPHDPLVPAGAPLTPPGASYLLGTDQIGFDILSRVLFGLRASLVGAFVVVSFGALVGALIGLTAGAMGGWVDSLLMRVTDVFLALPAPLLAIAVVAAMGPGYRNTLIAVAVVWWPWYARIVRGEIAAIRARPHVDAARLSGVSTRRLWLRHMLPGAVPEVVVLMTLDVGLLVLILAGLSFLGLGAPAPAPELGAMAAQGLRFLLSAWWVAVIPGVAVAFLALIANLAGDGLSDLIGD